MTRSVRFSKQHVWVKPLEKDRAQIGIAPEGLRRLGEIICMDWPLEGEYVKQEQPIGVLETSKTVIDLYAPVDGWVEEVNSDLKREPSKIHQDPCGEGWIAKLRLESARQLDELLTEEQYQTWVGKEE